MFSFSERVVVRNLLLAGIGLALGVCSYLFGVGGMLLPFIFCVTSFWVFVYSPRLLLRGGSVDLKLPIIALLVIPTVSVLFALSTEIREVQDYLLQFYRQDLQGVLIGSAATASSLEANGLKEQADTIRLAVAAAVPGWVVFGIWLVVAVFSSSGLVKPVGDTGERIKTLKTALLGAFLLLVLLFLPFISMNLYSENCIGRRCGLESGHVAGYLFLYCMSCVYVVCLLSVSVWLSMSCNVLRSMERSANESEH